MCGEIMKGEKPSRRINMSHSADIAKIKQQEEMLVFAKFFEADALSIGLDIIDRIKAANGFGLIEVRLWDRQLFAYSMPGATQDNAEWVRRKVNVVRRFHVSSYRKALELAEAQRSFNAAFGMDPMDYAAAGGCFPIRLKSGPVVGCITVSGLPQRDDHRIVVEAVAVHLGMDPAKIALD
jgi:uncharacterized protein (UPF0303 family)